MAKNDLYYQGYEDTDTGKSTMVYTSTGKPVAPEVLDRVYNDVVKDGKDVPKGFVVEPGIVLDDGRVVPQKWSGMIRKGLSDIGSTAESWQADQPAPPLTGLGAPNPQGVLDFLKGLPAKAVQATGVNTPWGAATTGASLLMPPVAKAAVPIAENAPWAVKAGLAGLRGLIAGTGTTAVGAGAEWGTGGSMPVSDMLKFGAAMSVSSGTIEGANLLINNTFTKEGAANFSKEYLDAVSKRNPGVAANPNLLNAALSTKEDAQTFSRLYGQQILKDGASRATNLGQQVIGDIENQMKTRYGGVLPEEGVVSPATVKLIERDFGQAVDATSSYLGDVLQGQKVKPLLGQLNEYENRIAGRLIDSMSPGVKELYKLTDDDIRLMVGNAFDAYRGEMNRYVEGARTGWLMNQSIDAQGKLDLADLSRRYDQEMMTPPGGLIEHMRDYMQQTPFSKERMQPTLLDPVRALAEVLPESITPKFLKGGAGPGVKTLPSDVPWYVRSLQGLEAGAGSKQPVDQNALKSFTGQSTKGSW